MVMVMVMGIYIVSSTGCMGESQSDMMGEEAL